MRNCLGASNAIDADSYWLLLIDNTISGKLDKYVKEIKKYEALSKSTDIEEK